MGLFLVVSFSGRAEAAFFKCAKEDFKTPPQMIDGRFRGTLQAVCTVTQASNGGLKGLSEFLFNSTLKSTIVHAGPVNTTFDQLNAVQFDITQKIPDGTIRSLVWIATDDTSRLSYSIQSQSMKLSGNAGLLEKLDVGFVVTPGSNAGEYSILLMNTVWVERPWYAPSDVFKNIAMDNARKEFQKNVQTMIPDVVRSL